MTAHRPPHPLNRHLFIADNLDLLRRLDNDSIDLICIDPPFKRRKTFVGKVKPPLTDAELKAELDTLAGWGISSPQQALDAGGLRAAHQIQGRGGIGGAGVPANLWRGHSDNIARWDDGGDGEGADDGVIVPLPGGFVDDGGMV